MPSRAATRIFFGLSKQQVLSPYNRIDLDRENERLGHIYDDDMMRTLMGEFSGIPESALTAFAWRKVLEKHGLRRSPAPSPPGRDVRVVIGCDPEFEVFFDGHLESASHYFNSHQLGHDGASIPAELRPSPGDGISITKSIQQLLRKAHNTLPEAEFVGGCGREFPLGGHIHMSGPILDVGARVEFLDEHLSQPLYEMCDTFRGERRRVSGYGSYYSKDSTALRLQPHGYEYRTPPSWLAHPYLTAGALTMAYVVMSMDKIPETMSQVLDAASEQERTILRRFINPQIEVPLEVLDMKHTWKMTPPMAPPLKVADPVVADQMMLIEHRPDVRSGEPEWVPIMDAILGVPQPVKRNYGDIYSITDGPFMGYQLVNRWGVFCGVPQQVIGESAPAWLVQPGDAIEAVERFLLGARLEQSKTKLHDRLSSRYLASIPQEVI